MENYLGEIRLFAGNYVPVDWHLCDGTLLSINENQALFSLMGVTYGGDGVTTFGLPDLRSRVPIGQGTGTGLTPRALASNGGTETVTLQEATTPAHTHTVYASTNTPTASSPAGNVPAATSSSAAQASGSLVFYAPVGNPPVTPTAMDPDVISNTGSGLPHANVMLSQPLNFIIALTGVYPQQQQ
jgi:microcystin-dependent protein